MMRTVLFHLLVVVCLACASACGNPDLTLGPCSPDAGTELCPANTPLVQGGFVALRARVTSDPFLNHPCVRVTAELGTLSVAGCATASTATNCNAQQVNLALSGDPNPEGFLIYHAGTHGSDILTADLRELTDCNAQTALPPITNAILSLQVDTPDAAAKP